MTCRGLGRRPHGSKASRISISPPPGRRLLVVAIDHMPSPITSSTSLWQDRPAPPYRPKMLAFFPGEISSVEDLPNHIILHPSDTRAGTSVY